MGSQGVGPLLQRLLSETGTRVHLIGHSYGCKVLLSAVCDGPSSARLADSMLLLQPAVSHLCFASDIDDTHRSGGYSLAPDRVRQPVLSTFSARDFPLRRAFHYAVRRGSDYAEARIAGEDVLPSRFAALGGYGPRHCDEKIIEVKDAGDRYELDSSVPVYGIRATRTIAGHGDISNESTWWALYNLLAEHRRDSE